MNDMKIDIATAMTARSTKWKNRQITWEELADKLSHEVRTNETLREYFSATKEEQGRIKDIGGYVGGYLRGGKRKVGSVMHRQLLTLDIDNGYGELWEDFTLIFDNAAVMHATHTYSPKAPRYRLIMPLTRPVTPDEYMAIGRRVAGDIGIDLFDNTTFEPSRLMYWPSVPKDQEYFYRRQEGEWLNPDSVLAQYTDWHDTSSWPTSQAFLDTVKDRAAKQEDPLEKTGVVGAFCKAYTIQEAISKYLPDVYNATGSPDRYTYRKGSTSCGLVLYDNKFAFSHHGTDPCSGQLCNAFDLVRIHLFGHLDEGSRIEGSKTKSFAAMEDLAMKDEKVKGIIAKEKMDSAKAAFAQEDAPDQEEGTEDDMAWMKELNIDKRGNYLSTANNVSLILANDARLKGMFRHNDFDSRQYIFRTAPWRKITTPEPVRNVDYAGVRNYIETVYGITGTAKIDDALELEFEKNHYHPVRQYLDSLIWDGEQRIDTLLPDYFGSDKNEYTRQAMRKILAGAVARVYQPGVKFDLVLVLVGDQGTGKSTLCKKLGRQWFSDTFLTVQGKEALEQIQGAWLIEIAELSGFRKAEVESVKHFISKQEDIFRPAYARAAETYPRQCVFFGTTNNREFLRDPTGNRRFMPVDIHRENAIKDIFTDLDGEVDQIWAEAVQIWKAGEPLYLTGVAEQMAAERQKSHAEVDERYGLIEDYLNRPLPKDWDLIDLAGRQMFLQSGDMGEIPRETVCVAEIWTECLGKNKEDMDRYKTREINDIMRRMEGWQLSGSTKNFRLYGKQKYYYRTHEDELL